MAGDVPTALHWRQAMQLASQVPPEEADAWMVLDCVARILRLSFEREPPPTAPDTAPGEGQVFSFPRRPNRRNTS